MSPIFLIHSGVGAFASRPRITRPEKRPHRFGACTLTGSRSSRVGAIGAKIAVPNPSPAGVWPYADSNFALVTVRNDNSVVVVDLNTGETLSRIEVQKSPDGVSMRTARP